METPTKLQNTISRLSALADQGRLFFPNPKLGVHGLEKEDAYQNFRPRILDWLVYGFRVCCTIRTVPGTKACGNLVQLKRGFTSDAQMAIDPRSLFTTMEELQELLSTGVFMDTTQQHASLIAVERLLYERGKLSILIQSPILSYWLTMLSRAWSLARHLPCEDGLPFSNL